MFKYKLALILALVPEIAFAQKDISDRNNLIGLPSAGYFFLALIAGLIIAFAFQLLLTNLSIAAGLEMLKNVTKPKAGKRGNYKNREVRQRESHRVNIVEGAAIPSKGGEQFYGNSGGRLDYREAEKINNRNMAGPEQRRDINKNYSSHSNSGKKKMAGKKSHPVRKINAAYGLWTLITGSITMFFAAWLAGELSLTFSAVMGAVLGLSIWGVFYIATTYLEIRAVSSLVGSITKLAITGLRTSYDAVSSIFSSSAEKKMVKTSAKITRAVRRELFRGIDMDDVRDQIEDIVEKLRPAEPMAQSIAKEFSKILNHAEFRAIINHEGPMYEQDTIVASMKTNGMSAKKAESIVNTVNDVFTKIKEEAINDSKDSVSKVADSVMRIAGMSDIEAHDTRRKVESYLRSTGIDELNPEGIKHDMEMLVKHPKEGFSSLKERISHIDKESLVRILAQRKDMTEKDARVVVDNVLNAVNDIIDTTTHAYNSIINKLSVYLNSLNRPELNYEGIREDLKRLFTADRKAGADSLMRRLKAIDRDTIRAMIARYKDIPEDQAEETVMKIEKIRDGVLQKASSIKSEIIRRVDLAQYKALQQAENVRKTAANAAWWAFGTAAVSGIAAVLGGIVASTTGF